MNSSIANGTDSQDLFGQVQIFLDDPDQDIDMAYICTGTVIAREWVLTAKHCITDNLLRDDTAYILIGDLRLDIGIVHHIAPFGIYLHPYADAALLKLIAPANEEMVAPWGKEQPTVGDVARVRAWGYINDVHTLPNTLQTGRFSVTSQQGPDLYPPELGSRANVMTLVPTGDERMKKGDSGSGIQIKGLICGVQSTTDDVGDEAAAVKTDSIAPWIERTTHVAPSGSCKLSKRTKLKLRIMAMGDVLTTGVGSGLRNAYRNFLYDRLSEDHLEPNFVGSATYGIPPADHLEESDKIANIDKKARCAIYDYAPDIVTLDVGHEDIYHPPPGSPDVASRANSLISTILHVSPRTIVLVAPLPPDQNTRYKPDVDAFNTAIKLIVGARKNAGQHVDFVDPGWTIDDTDRHLSSEPFIRETGYKKMANAFDMAIETADNNDWIPDKLSLNKDLCDGTTTTNPTGPAQDPAAPAKTFTVNAGGASFTTTLPNNSVATYTWTDDGKLSEWLTTASGSGFRHKLQSVPVVKFAEPTDTITVDTGTTHQRIDGFGGAMTDSAAALILSSPQREQIMRTLFGTGDGEAGLTIVRSPMGSSDLMADGSDFHTYEDTRGSFSAEAYPSDRRQIEALQQAKKIAGSDFKLLGTPWTAPGWAKRGKSLRPKECGTDHNELDRKAVQDYAAYFKKYVDAYASKGIKPWMVSMQNEPENCKTEMPTTLLSPTDAVMLAEELKKQLPGDVKVLGWDHNWNDPHYVEALTSGRSRSVDAIGYHCYDGTHYSTQTQAVATYMTECSGFTDQSGDVAGNLGWEVANLLIGPMRAGARGSIYWTLAQDSNGNPRLAGNDACKNCRGMITVNGGSFEPSQDFYFWAHFSKFVRPGAVRLESSNSGDLSTVAFRDGNRTTLVVLNSTHHAGGGAAGSDERDLRGHILQYNGENAGQKTAWLVGADGYRRWIDSGSTFNCLKYDAGMQGPDEEPGGALDKYINLKDVWAVCGSSVMGTNSQLEVGTYLKSSGGARLSLTKDGLQSTDSSGDIRWNQGGEGNGIGDTRQTGDRLILQEDQNLVLYSKDHPIWSSGTKDSGAVWLAIHDDGVFVLYNKDNQKVWTSELNDYRGKIVQWNGDTSSQKTSWLVGNDGKRRVIHDWETFECLHDAGAGNSSAVSSDVLEGYEDLNNVWATCGGDKLSTNGALEQGSHMKAGSYTLMLISSDLVLSENGKKVWSTGKGGAQLKLQTDGNLVIYDKNGRANWATNTFFGAPRGYTGWLMLSSTGELILYGKKPDGTSWSLNLRDL